MKKLFSVFLATLLFLTVLPVSAEETASALAWQAYNGKRLGVLTGTLMEDIAYTNFPDSEYLLLNSYPDCIAALLANKIDAYLGDEPSLKTIHAEQPKIDYIHERITNQEYSFAFRKNDPQSAALCAELNAFLALCHQDGTLQELDDIWFGVDEERKVVDMSDLTGENGTIRVVTTSTDMPFSYIKDGKNVGYDIDLVVRFCRHAGYKLELGDVDFAARIPAIQSGKYDFTTDMNVTEERKEQVLFSDPTSTGGVVLAILTEGNATETAQTAPAASLSPLDWDGRRMGIVTGSSFEAATLENYPNSEYLYYNTNSDVVTALIMGKIDGFLGDEPVIRVMCQEVPEMTYLPEMLTHDDYAFGFGKNSQRADTIRGQFNEMLGEILSDGTMDALLNKWFGGDEAAKTVDLTTGFSGENGKLNVVTTATDMPFSYVKDNQYVGLSIELVELFCRRYGYTPVIEDVDFAARIPGLVSGKYDMCASSMVITEERKESINFSDPFYKGGIVLAIRTEDRPAELTDGQRHQGKQPITSLAMLAQPGANIAVGLDTPAEGALARDYPEAKITPYTDIVLAYLDVANGRMDACVNARTEMKFAIQNGFTGVRLLDENYFSTKIAVGISPASPIPDLKGKLNAFIAEAKADGTLDDMYDRWVIRGEDTLPDIPPAENPSLTLRVGTTGSVMPYSYYVGTELAGYDIELAHRFASWLGAELEFKVYDFGGIIPAAEAGAIDCIMSNLFYTDEKEEAIPFSDVLFEVEITAMVRDDGQGEPSVPEAKFTSLSQLDGKRVGVLTGTISGQLVENRFPHAQVNYYTTQADSLTALKAGKIDAWSTDEPVIRFMKIENPELVILDEYLAESNLAAVFPKTEAGQALRDQYSEFLEKLWADGTMAQIDAVWFGADDAVRTVMDYESLPAANGTLRMAADLTQPPFSYMKDGRAVGYDVDVAARFCQQYGYGLEIEGMSFDGVLAAVQSGKCDFASSCITITEERSESMLFSLPNYYGGIAVAVWDDTVMVARKAKEPAAAVSVTNNTQQEETFWDSLKSSFNKTFIREGRWKLFLEGIGNTMLITLLSILFGTALGFLVFMLCRNGNIAANGVTRFSMWLVMGTPMVVLLMILYYIIFGSVAISGITVAVIGFTLTFGAAVFSMLKMGVGTIDRGQYEAAYALGHSNRHTFFKIILPQAIPHVLPAYQGEIVGLIKATAIVGYIAVQDLTKMGDIVRSRTYEAFFPLIAVTVIYFVLEGLFSFAVSRIRVSIDPKKRKRESILKGVDLHD